MARGNRLLGTLRGKLGDTVYYRSRGYQIERPRVVPKNPRSRAQMGQRVKIANVSAVYRALKPILSRSFAVRGQHESSFNAFSRAAMDLSPYMTKTMVAKCLALPMPVQLSRGGLGTYEYTEFQGENGLTFVRLPIFSDGPVPTVALWSQRFIAENPQFQEGDTIVMCMIQFVENTVVSEPDAYNAIGKYATLTLDFSNGEPITEVGWAADSTTSTILPNGWPSVNEFNSSDFIGMSGAFVARKTESGDIDVSSQYFVLTEGAQDLYDKYRTDLSLNTAISSYGVGTDRVV